MGEFATEAIQEALSGRLGSALRGVVCYDGTEFDCALRDDVAALYSEGDVRTFVDNSIVHQLGEATDERVYELGCLEGVIRQFETAWVGRVSTGRQPKRGCLFFIERNNGVTIEAVDDCLDIVEQRVRR